MNQNKLQLNLTDKLFVEIDIFIESTALKSKQLFASNQLAKNKS